MLLSPRKNGLTSLFKEVRVLKVTQAAPCTYSPFVMLSCVSRPGQLQHSLECATTTLALLYDVRLAIFGWRAQVTSGTKRGGLAKGVFCKMQCHAQGPTKKQRALCPAVHLALKAPQPREARTILQKPPPNNPFLGS